MHRRSRAIFSLFVAVVTIAALPLSALGVPADVVGTVRNGFTGVALPDIRVRVWIADDAWNGDLDSPVGETLTAANGTYLLPSMPDEYLVYAFIDETSTFRDVTAENRGFPPEDAFGYMALVDTITIDADLMPLETVVDERTYRIGGATRYQTAINISEANFAKADTVIIASGASFPDALAAAPLAGALDAPVLLTPRNHLPAGLAQEIIRLQATNVIIIGGSGAVSEVVEAELAGIGLASLDRLAGADRYATASLVAQTVATMNQLDGLAPRVAFICRGDAFPDALAASPLAYRHRIPILLTRSTTLPSATALAWSVLSANNDFAYVIGGEGAVREDVLQQFAESSATGQIRYRRFAGSNRYATAADLVMGWMPSYDTLGLATGQSFPDALAGGAATGYWSGALLLTPSNSLATSTTAALQQIGPHVMDMQAYGGTGALSDATVNAADTALGTKIYDIDAPDNRVQVTGSAQIDVGSVFEQSVWPFSARTQQVQRRSVDDTDDSAIRMIHTPSGPMTTIEASE